MPSLFPQPHHQHHRRPQTRYDNIMLQKPQKISISSIYSLKTITPYRTSIYLKMKIPSSHHHHHHLTHHQTHSVIIIIIHSHHIPKILETFERENNQKLFDFLLCLFAVVCWCRFGTSLVYCIKVLLLLHEIFNTCGICTTTYVYIFHLNNKGIRWNISLCK